MSDQTFRTELGRATPRVLRLARRMAPTGVDPDDLVQDVLERAWTARASFRGDADITTWLHRILVNRAADLNRRKRPTTVPVETVDEAKLIDLEVADPQLLLERAADAELLRVALSRLEPIDRTVLVLHDGEGWPVQQIADPFGLSVDAAHKRLQRARLRLVHELGAQPPRGDADVTACRRARAAASDYLDGRLDDSTRAQVDSHLRDCTRCPPLIQALVGLRPVLAASPSPEIPARLRSALSDLPA